MQLIFTQFYFTNQYVWNSTIIFIYRSFENRAEMGSVLNKGNLQFFSLFYPRNSIKFTGYKYLVANLLYNSICPPVFCFSIRFLKQYGGEENINLPAFFQYRRLKIIWNIPYTNKDLAYNLHGLYFSLSNSLMVILSYWKNMIYLTLF